MRAERTNIVWRGITFIIIDRERDREREREKRERERERESESNHRLEHELLQVDRRRGGSPRAAWTPRARRVVDERFDVVSESGEEDEVIVPGPLGPFARALLRTDVPPVAFARPSKAARTAATHLKAVPEHDEPGLPGKAYAGVDEVRARAQRMDGKGKDRALRKCPCSRPCCHVYTPKVVFRGSGGRSARCGRKWVAWDDQYPSFAAF